MEIFNSGNKGTENEVKGSKTKNGISQLTKTDQWMYCKIFRRSGKSYEISLNFFSWLKTTWIDIRTILSFSNAPWDNHAYARVRLYIVE